MPKIKHKSPNKYGAKPMGIMDRKILRKKPKLKPTNNRSHPI